MNFILKRSKEEPLKYGFYAAVVTWWIVTAVFLFNQFSQILK